MARDTSIFQGVQEFSIGAEQLRCECRGRGQQPVKIFVRRGNAYIYDRTIVARPTCADIERAYLDSLDE
jgi:hypothetical protein